MGIHCIYLLAVTLFTTEAHQNFQLLIPNGDKVPHPCGGGGADWNGVGHLLPGGGGARNQFGIDFQNSGKKWTRELCEKDSDGDGRTNGVELGDPGCTWMQGAAAHTSTGISHPGICEPIDSPACRKHNERFGTSLACDTTLQQECPAISQPDTLRQATRFPVTRVPAEITNYFCMLFDLPSDGDYHLVATSPIINNTALLHHMILFGCQLDSEEDMRAIDPHKNKPYKCGMSPHAKCQQIIGTWTLGSRGDCASQNAGFRIGTKGYRVAALQVHWNNRLAMPDQFDSPGMSLYYTASRRQSDAAVFVVGQEYLAIPPHARGAAFHARCPGDCTAQMFKQDVYVTRAVNHMHYFGQSQEVSVYRDGKKLRELTNDQNYNYDNPIFHHFDPPVVLKPGDEIRTRCVYNSNSSQATYFGAGTNDEMCYAFLTYYPSHSLPPTLCASWRNVQRCHRYLPKFGGMLGECRWRSLISPADPESKKTVSEYFAPEACGSFLQSEKCSDNCTGASETIAKHACLQGEVGEWVRYKMRTSKEGQLFVKTMKTCGAFVNEAAFAYSHKQVVIGIVSVLLCIVFT